jgi:GT2 family glycosyltransferase
MTSVVEANPRIGILGPGLVYPNGLPQTSALAGNPTGKRGMFGMSEPVSNRKGAAIRVILVRGSAVLIRARLISAIGLFDEGYGLAFFEDEDYCFRTRRAGYEVLYYPAVTLVHHGAAATSKLPTYLYNFLGYRNMIRFAVLNLSGAWLTSCFLLLIVSVFFAKKDPHGPIWLSNLRAREDLGLHVRALGTALFVNIGKLPELLRLRRQRLRAHLHKIDGQSLDTRL